MNNAPTTDQSRQGASNNIHIDVTTKPSLRSAINAKCRECIYCPLTGTGTWRQQTAACSSKGCPLWPVRPMPYPANKQMLNALKSPENGQIDRNLDSGKGGV